jgi:dTDP-4-dehydrorhamnose reductase
VAVRLHVTGATGFLGRDVVRLAPDASTTRVDVRDARAVGRLFARLQPDAVLHAAYLQDGPDAWDVNVLGSENVARAAAAVGARLVHVSTDVVFDGRKGSPYVEGDRPSPCTAYGRSKAEAELRVAAVHPGALVVRTSLLVGGPGHEPSRHELTAHDPGMTFFTDELRSPAQVTDLARALLELSATGLTGALHVAGPDDVSRAELAELVTGAPVRSGPAPRGRPTDCRLDSSRARSLVRTRVRGVRDVLATPF